MINASYSQKKATAFNGGHYYPSYRIKRIRTVTGIVKVICPLNEPPVRKTNYNPIQRATSRQFQKKESYEFQVGERIKRIGWRPSRLSRITKKAYRKDDSAGMARIELIDSNKFLLKEKPAQRYIPRRKRRVSKGYIGFGFINTQEKGETIFDISKDKVLTVPMEMKTNEHQNKIPFNLEKHAEQYRTNPAQFIMTDQDVKNALLAFNDNSSGSFRVENAIILEPENKELIIGETYPLTVKFTIATSKDFKPNMLKHFSVSMHTMYDGEIDKEIQYAPMKSGEEKILIFNFTPKIKGSKNVYVNFAQNTHHFLHKTLRFTAE